MSNVRTRRERLEQGSALFVTVMMLVLMGFIGLASLDTVTADRQVAGFQTRARVALDAADAGVARALANIWADVDNIHALPGVAALQTYNPPFPGGPTALSDMASWQYGQPSFSADPGVPAAIDYLDVGGACDFIISMDAGVTWRKSIWEIRVQGTTNDGVNTRVQATASLCRPYSS